MSIPFEDELEFGEGVEDEDLLTTIESWKKESLAYHDVLLQAQEMCLQYYEGKQTGIEFLPGHASKTTRNRIFEGTETIIPIVTTTAHRFIALPGNEDEVSLKRAQKVQAVLERKYDDLGIQGQLEDVTRDMILKRFGVMEWYWDFDLDDVGVRVVDPKLILIPKRRVPANELPYVMRILEFTKEEFMDEFPDFDEDKIKEAAPVNVGKEIQRPERITQVMETWTDDFVVWSMDNEIIDKKPNPYWDFGIREKDKGKGEGKDEEPKKVGVRNHLNKPTKPFVFFTPFRTGEAPVSLTSLCEQVIPIQDDINIQKRRILDNLRQMGNGQVYIDNGVMDQEQIDSITNEPGQIITGDGVASENRVRREPGVPLPAAHFNNLQDSISAFDDIFGVHPSTRGSGQSRTLGGQVLNKQQDQTRIDTLTRELNRGVAELADGIVQMFVMFYDRKRLFRFVGEKDAIEFINFSRDEVDDNVVVDVKGGNTFPIDPEARSQRAIQLFQLGALDPTTLYRELGFPNPELTAGRLLAWLQGQVLQDTQAQIATAIAGAQAKAQAEPGSERQVEQGLNSSNRAKQEATGTTPAKLPNQSK